MDENQPPNPWQTPATRDPQGEPDPRRGGDSRRPNFDSAVEVIGALWRDHRSTLLSAWGTFAAIWLMSTLVLAVASLALGMDPASQQEMIENMSASSGDPFAFLDVFGTGYWVLVGVSILLGFVQVGVGIATLGPVRRGWFEGRTLSIAEVIGEMGRRIASGALLYFIVSIAFTIGTLMCCIPGLLVGYFTMPAFYLVGGRGDGIFDSLSTGFKWAKRHVALIVILIVIAVVVAVMLFFISAVTSQIMLTFGNVGYVVTQIVSWFFGVIVSFLIWICYAGTMISIEQGEEQSGQW